MAPRYRAAPSRNREGLRVPTGRSQRRGSRTDRSGRRKFDRWRQGEVFCDLDGAQIAYAIALTGASPAAGNFNHLEYDWESRSAST